MSDWAAKPGRTAVFDNGYCPWKSRWAMFRAYTRWLRKLLKQVFCFHRQWYFNACGRMELTPDEAVKWYKPFLAPPLTDMIRINYTCSRCGKWRHVYVPSKMVGYR